MLSCCYPALTNAGAVAIKCADHWCARGEDTGPYSAALASILAVADDAQHWKTRLQVHETCTCIVAGCIIHKHHLEGAAIQRAMNLGDQGFDIAGFIVNRNDNGKFE